MFNKISFSLVFCISGGMCEDGLCVKGEICVKSDFCVRGLEYV